MKGGYSVAGPVPFFTLCHFPLKLIYMRVCLFSGIVCFYVHLFSFNELSFLHFKRLGCSLEEKVLCRLTSLLSHIFQLLLHAPV